MRAVCIAKWGSEAGLDLIDKLSQLFTAIVWENSLLVLVGPPFNLTQNRPDVERLIEALGNNPPANLST